MPPAALPSAARVLVVDDEENISYLVASALRLAGLEVRIAGTAVEALADAAAYPPDAVVLDVMLPDLDGFETLKRLRGRGIDAPVLFLSARSETADRVRGLTSGGDDYIVKPFAMSELSARIRAVLRRIRPGLAEDRVHIGDLTIDRVDHRVKRAGKEIHLGPTEFRLLDYLMQHPGRVFSREQLLDAVWGSDVYVEARTVDVHVGRLRKALNVEGTVNPIRTVRSAGYALDAGKG